jgi:DNA polymerase III delta prime subunit
MNSSSDRAVRIAVSGPSGTGKTTLAKALAEDLGTVVLAEGMKNFYAAKDKMMQLEANKQPSENLEQGLRAWVNEFFLWLEVRGQEYNDNKSFVADRWEADLLFAWLGQFGSHRVDKQTIKLVSAMRDRSKLFDLIILTPVSEAKAPSRNEDGLMRRQTLAAQLASRSMVIGLIQQFSKTPVLALPGKDLSTEQRIEIVKKKLVELGRID